MSVSRLLSGCIIVAVACSLEVQGQNNAGATLLEGARLIVGDGSPPIENAAFTVEGDHFTWVGRSGERPRPPRAVRVDLTGKTVMPALIDGHNHIGLTDERDGSNSKANYTRDNLIDQLERYAYYGVSATLSMGLEADQELAYEHARREAARTRRGSSPWGRASRRRRSPVRPASRVWAFRTARGPSGKGGSTSRSCTRAACISSRSGSTTAMAPSPSSSPMCIARSSRRRTPTAWRCSPT